MKYYGWNAKIQLNGIEKDYKFIGTAFQVAQDIEMRFGEIVDENKISYFCYDENPITEEDKKEILMIRKKLGDS